MDNGEWLERFGVNDMREIGHTKKFKKLVEGLCITGYSLRNGLLEAYNADSYYCWTHPDGPCVIHGTIFPFRY